MNNKTTGLNKFNFYRLIPLYFSLDKIAIVLYNTRGHTVSKGRDCKFISIDKPI